MREWAEEPEEILQWLRGLEELSESPPVCGRRRSYGKPEEVCTLVGEPREVIGGADDGEEDQG